MSSAREAARSLQTASLLPAKLTETLAADRVISPAEVKRFNLFSFDPDGAVRNVDLPPEAHSEGVVLIIANAGVATEIITVRNDAAATIATPDGAEAALVFCDGVAWFGLTGESS
jgi:hypothetical protein